MDFFIFNHRLGIPVPDVERDWAMFSKQEQEEILIKWETIRGRIPDRIIILENEINRKQNQLNQEENFKLSCQLNSDISELASKINDLHLWYRVNQETSVGKMHS